MLALSFLVLVGMTLIAEGFEHARAEGLHLLRDGVLARRRDDQHPPAQPSCGGARGPAKGESVTRNPAVREGMRIALAMAARRHSIRGRHGRNEDPVVPDGKWPRMGRDSCVAGADKAVARRFSAAWKPGRASATAATRSASATAVSRRAAATGRCRAPRRARVFRHRVARPIAASPLRRAAPRRRARGRLLAKPSRDRAGERRAVDDEAQLGVEPHRARIEVERADEDARAIDREGLGVQARAEELPREPRARRPAGPDCALQLVQLDARFEQRSAPLRVAGMHGGTSVASSELVSDASPSRRAAASSAKSAGRLPRPARSTARPAPARAPARR